jgi:hypothetical protein
MTYRPPHGCYLTQSAKASVTANFQCGLKLGLGRSASPSLSLSFNRHLAQ